MLFFTMLLVAMLDYFAFSLFGVVVPDKARWALSGLAYTAVLAIAWRQCLRQLLHAPDARQLARLVEHAEPKLREDLISAVELGDAKGEVFDSEQFRGLLQTDVAHRMENMEMKSLLPMALIRRYIGYTAVIAACIITAMVATNGQFFTLLLRALAPGANLDNVSRTKVILREPVGGNMMVPQGDTVRVVVELKGERTGKAVLEAESEKEGALSIPMLPLGDDRFAATVQVNRENVRYRIKAGDALTKRYLLDARERPFVTTFQKTYTYPAYSKLPTKTVTETDGGLAALEGTEVELKLKPNQAVKTAELRLEQGKKSTAIALTPTADGQLSAKVPLMASGSYRVFLVSAATGFENKFSPENELRAEPDLVPSVELDSPKNDLILPNNELVDVLGHASDDLALAKVAQLVKVNDGAWKETVLLREPGQKTRVETRWDLYAMSVKPGDLVTTKLVATDLKGNKGESRPLQITITAAGFELRRLQALENLRALNLAVRGMSKAAEGLEKSAVKARDAFAGDGRQAVMAATGALAEFEVKYVEAWTSLGAALREAPAGHTSGELVMLGRQLAKLNLTNMKSAKGTLDLLARNPGIARAKELMNEATDNLVKLNGRAHITEAATEAFVAAEEAAALTENGQVVAREQQRLMELAVATGEDVARWTALTSRLRVAMTQTKALEDLLAPMAAREGTIARDRAKSVSKELATRRGKLELALLGEPSGKTLLQPTLELTRTLKNYAGEFANWHREFGYRPVEMMRDLANDAGSTYGNVTRLDQELTTLRADEKLAADTRVALSELRWNVRADVFKAHGDLEEVRAQADNTFVGDLRLASTALQALQAVAAGTEAAKISGKLTGFARDFSVLESGHSLQEVFDGLNTLATSERWDIRSLSVRTQSPRDWRWAEGRLRLLPEELGKAKDAFGDEVEMRKVFEAAQGILWKAGQMPAWNAISVEMEQRASADRPPASTKADVELLAGEVKRALDLLRKQMDAARKRLESVAPKISELAAALAKEQDEQKKETEQQAEKVAAQKPEEAKAENQKQLAKQEQLDAKVESLKDLIRAQANQQNILDKEQREKMRDADDALALLKEPPPKAEQALQDAANDAQSQQKADLNRAAEQQQKLASALEQIAKHFEAEEQGKPLAETRAALREAEKELGVKGELDQQFAHAQMVAEMAQKNAADLLKELEAKLPENPEMQKALSQISKDTLAAAEQKLADASKKENAVAKQMEQQAAQEKGEAPQPEKTLAQAAQEAQTAAQAAFEAAKNAERQASEAKNDTAKQQADNAAEFAKDAAKAAGDAVKAAEKMANAANDKDAAKAAQKAADKAGEAAQLAQQASALAQQAQKSGEQAAKAGGEKQGKNEQSAQQAAEAVKQADKAAQAAQQAQQLAQSAQQKANATAQNAEQLKTAQEAAQSAADAAKQAAGAAKQAAQSAKAAEAQAKTAANEPAEQAAAKAGSEAAKAAESAQAAAQNAEQVAKTGDAKQAAKAAQTAAQNAGEAADAAQQAANDAQAAQGAAEKAAQQLGEHAAQNQQASQQAAQSAKQAQQAVAAAKQAQALAQQSAARAAALVPPEAAQPSSPLAQAAQQQQPIAANAQDAGADVERAARHEMRLGNQPTGDQLQKLGAQIQDTAKTDVPKAADALKNAPNAQAAQAPVAQANVELAKDLAALKNTQNSAQPPQGAQPPTGEQAQQNAAQTGTPASPQAAGQPPSGQSPAGQPSGQQSAAQGEQAPASPAEQAAMARALDALDQQINGQPPAGDAAQASAPPAPAGQPGEPQSGQPSGQPSDAASAAQAAMAQAAQAAAASMRQSRAQQGMAQIPSGLMSQSQSEKSLAGAQAQAPAMDYDLKADAQGLKRGEWGKLPKKLADQLTKGQQEAIAGDYRQAVETYYKVIAEKAKK